MKFKSLDGWRGVCAVFVVLFHLPLRTAPFDGLFVRHSYLFVDFFFVLSGFVISYAYGTRLRSTAELVNFGVRRFARLWPLHIAMLAVLVLLEIAKAWQAGSYGAGFSPSFSGTRSIPLAFANIFFVQTVRPEPLQSWNVPSWSISVEFWTYFLFGLLQIVWFRRRVLAAAIVCIGSVGILYVKSGAGIDTIAGLAFFRCFYGFFLGTLLYESIHRRPNEKASLSFSMATVLEIASVGITACFVIVVGMNAYSLVGPLLFATVILIHSTGAGAISALLKTAFFQLLGRLSYSIYMVHAVLLIVVGRAFFLLDRKFGTDLHWTDAPNAHIAFDHDWQGLVFAFCILALTIGLSTLTYRFIELPGMRFFGPSGVWARNRSVSASG
jgi:peptidoglycan/LPS O-acetylase OafA/YrhL